jgi:hypothetical protein
MNSVPAPAQRVVIHVGTPKSGTTYLQDTMWESRAALLDAGVLYPATAGRTTSGRSSTSETMAILTVATRRCPAPGPGS